jgi:D-alanyl-lipoteichoic acid acyltransferase DltB (MBOAT superfamily)
MNFNSWQYLVFFPLVFALYYAITWKNRRWSKRASQIMLLAASLFFYACWNPAYLALMLLSVVVTWLSGILIEGKAERHKRLVLLGSLVINLGILFFFKYYNFFAESLEQWTSFKAPAFNVLLPVGISFYTFQALGYSIDVYRGTVKAEHDFINYALFVTFFPQLVAGPIERTGRLLPQFKVNHVFDYDQVTGGLKLAAWGMFKKVVIADRLAVYVNGVYSNPSVYPAASLALATFFFAIQIYCDFSGYSDIAIGSARALGFDLMTNFRRPYFARSISDFWRRWHISLTTWFKDYIYIPLGGNRKGLARQCFNILLVFSISGLWHGAAWHFVAWGLIHGILQVVERIYREISGRRKIVYTHTVGAAVNMIITFIVVCIAWVFFRADSIGSAFGICAKFLTLPAEVAAYIRQLPHIGFVGILKQMFQLGSEAQGLAHPIVGFGMTEGGIALIVITILLFVELLGFKIEKKEQRIYYPVVLRWAAYAILVILIIMNFGVVDSDFIYFTF